jgi:hypothetical protein
LKGRRIAFTHNKQKPPRFEEAAVFYFSADCLLLAAVC